MQSGSIVQLVTLLISKLRFVNIQYVKYSILPHFHNLSNVPQKLSIGLDIEFFILIMHFQCFIVLVV